MTIQPALGRRRREPLNIAKLSKTEEFSNITKQMLDTYVAKNHDYGNSFSKSFEEFGLIAAAVRMNDKMERLKSFAQMSPLDAEVKSESIQDTLLDLANYAIMTVMELNKPSNIISEENKTNI